MPKRIILSALLTACICAACGSAGSAGPQAARPRFVHGVRNPWFPLPPGTTFVYTGEKDGAQGRDVFRVTRRTKRIDGVTCTEVDDRLYAAGHLAERTKDWYAQDVQGNVWYFGEATAELDKSGQVTSREGSWQSGVAGAKAGIFMPARPTAGQAFRQEYYKGQAEDHFKVLGLSASVKVPALSSHQAMRTEETTPLEPDVVDNKYYVRGIGTVREETVKGPRETNVLISMKRG